MSVAREVLEAMSRNELRVAAERLGVSADEINLFGDGEMSREILMGLALSEVSLSAPYPLTCATLSWLRTPANRSRAKERPASWSAR